jgi:SAM-dependent methyltransferase
MKFLMKNKYSSNNISIYNRPKLYDDIMWWKKDDISFWETVVKKFKCKSVLEVCCGTGRIGLPLIQNKIDYYGIDISESFINFFASKTSNYNTNKLIVGDASKFKLNKKFDLVFIGFNSLAHLLTNQEVTSFLNCVQNHMHQDSIFGIDIFMPSHELISNIDNDKVDLMNFIYSRTQKELNILESTKYNSKTEVNNISWEFINQNNNPEFIYNFDMRIFFPDTLNRLLTDSKFHINSFYGDYELEPFNENSEKQIYICSK